MSVKRGAGSGPGSGSLFNTFFLFLSFFLCIFSFLFLNPNSDFSRFASALHHFDISAYQGNEKRAIEVQVHHPKQSTSHLYTYKHYLYFNTTFQFRQSNIEATIVAAQNQISSSAAISAMKVHKFWFCRELRGPLFTV